MANSKGTINIFLGDYVVDAIDNRAGTVTILLGRGLNGDPVHIHMHMQGVPFTCKAGDKVPLFTRVPYEVRNPN